MIKLIKSNAKKILLILLAAVMIISVSGLTGCDNGDKNSEEFLKYMVTVRAYGDNGVKELKYGSGMVVYTGNGVTNFITNYHVVNDSDVLRIETPDTVADVKLLGYSSYHDIAVIQLDREWEAGMPNGSGLVFSDCKVGEGAWSLGNLKNGGISIHSGEVVKTSEIVTASDLTYIGDRKYVPVLSVTCNIGPGKSGGAVLNAKGELIGVGAYNREEKDFYAVSSLIVRAVYEKVMNGAMDGSEVFLVGGTDCVVRVTDGYGGISVLCEEGNTSAAYNSLHELGFSGSMTMEGFRVLKTGSSCPLVVGDLIKSWNGVELNSRSVIYFFTELYRSGIAESGTAVKVVTERGEVEMRGNGIVWCANA